MSDSAYDKGDSGSPAVQDTPLKRTHKTALERFRLVAEAEFDQRKRELDDLKFKALDQWPDDIVIARQGSAAQGGKDVVPARPMLVIPVLDQPISQVVNQGRMASLAIKVSPRKEATTDDARVFEGLVRNIEYESDAQTAYIWAYERAVIAGRGFFRINTDWADEEGGFDQVIRVERILNQGSVYLDPYAQRADWKDGEWAFVTEDIPVDRYKREYPKTKLAKMEKGNAGDETFVGLGNEINHWIVGSDESPCYRIAEYWYYEYDATKETSGEKGSDDYQEREVKNRRLMWCKLNGVEFLEEPREWDGPDIPLVPVLGMEYNLGGRRCFNGIVRPARDACRMINYMASSLAEQSGLATKAPYLVIAGQLQGFENAWQQANTRNLMALEYNAVTKSTGAQILPPPVRDVANPPIDHMTTSIAVFTNFVRSTTGVPDAALGHVNPNDKSGKAIEALKQAAEAGNSNWLDNLGRAIQRAGEIVVNLIPKKYDRPGRVLQIIGVDDEQETVMVNQPYVMQGQQPQPVMPGTTHLKPGQTVKEYDLRKGKYNVVVEVGKSYSTMRAEGLAGMSALMQAAPQLAPVISDLWVKDMDFPGAQAIAKRLEKANPLADHPDQPEIPPEVQQKLQINAKMIEELSAQLKQLAQERDGKLIENQTKLAIEKMDNDTKLQIARMQAAVQLATVDAKLAAENARTFIEDAEERLAHQVDMLDAKLSRSHDHAMQGQEHAHARQLAEEQHQRAKDLAEQGQQHALDSNEQVHEQALEQAQQSAELTPTGE